MWAPELGYCQHGALRLFQKENEKKAKRPIIPKRARHCILQTHLYTLYTKLLKSFEQNENSSMRSNKKSFLKVLYFIKLWYRCGFWSCTSVRSLAVNHYSEFALLFLLDGWMKWVNSSWFISCLVVVETVYVYKGWRYRRKCYNIVTDMNNEPKNIKRKQKENLKRTNFEIIE